MANYQAEPGGLGDKFRLLYTVACDERASRSHTAVMAVLLWRFNRSHGCCWPSLASISTDAGLDERTTQRAVNALEDWGYIHTVRVPGKLHRYVPHFQAQNGPSTPGTNDRGTPGMGDRGDPRHSRPRPPTNTSQTPGMDVVGPPARTPPESLNESITESKKEIRDDNCNSFSLSEGNQETEEQKQERIREEEETEKRLTTIARSQYLKAKQDGNQNILEMIEKNHWSRVFDLMGSGEVVG